jgi:hypothetical protein
MKWGFLMKTLRKSCGLLACSILVGLLIVPTVGCGDDEPAASPFEGTYQMLVHTRNTDGCEEGTPFEGDDYFQLTESDGSLNYQTCEAVGDCSSSVNTSKSFAVQDGDGWRNIDIQAVDVRLGCDVTLIERTAELNNGDLSIEQRTFEGEVERQQGEDCTDELISNNRGSLSCERYEVVVAVPAE